MIYSIAWLIFGAALFLFGLVCGMSAVRSEIRSGRVWMDGKLWLLSKEGKDLPGLYTSLMEKGNG